MPCGAKEQGGKEVAYEDRAKVIKHLVAAFYADDLCAEARPEALKHRDGLLVPFYKDVGRGQGGDAGLDVGERLEGVERAEGRALFFERGKLGSAVGAARVEKELAVETPRFAEDLRCHVGDLPVLGRYGYDVGSLHCRALSCV